MGMIQDDIRQTRKVLLESGFIAPGKVVVSNGFDLTTNLPIVISPTSNSTPPIGVVFEDFNSGPGWIMSEGAFVTALNLTTSQRRDPLYFTSNGSLTLTDTGSRQVAEVLQPGSGGNNVVYVNIAGYGSRGQNLLDILLQKGDLLTRDGSGNLIRTPAATGDGTVLTVDTSKPGNLKWATPSSSGGSGNEFEETLPEKLASIDISPVDTNTTLYTVPASTYPKNIKIIATNRGVSAAKIRIAHIDGALGAIANEDYLIFDEVIYPNSDPIIIPIPGASPTDTFMIRSDTLSVSFTIVANKMITDHGIKRLYAFDIDGITNIINQGYSVLSTSASQVASFIFRICNRNSFNIAFIKNALVDSSVAQGASITPGTDDYILNSTDILENESRQFQEVLKIGNSKSLSFESDISNINIIVYGKKT